MHSLKGKIFMVIEAKSSGETGILDTGEDLKYFAQRPEMRRILLVPMAHGRPELNGPFFRLIQKRVGPDNYVFGRLAAIDAGYTLDEIALPTRDSKPVDASQIENSLRAIKAAAQRTRTTTLSKFSDAAHDVGSKISGFLGDFGLAGDEMAAGQKNMRKAALASLLDTDARTSLLGRASPAMIIPSA
jgi:hypothetical protein